MLGICLLHCIRNFVRFFLEHLYTTIAWAYDLVAWMTSVGQWRNWQQAALDVLPAGSLLELGHGPGHLLFSLSQEGRKAIGVDLSKQMTRLASKRLRKAVLPARIARARAQALPFPNSHFDALFSTFPSEYIFDQRTFDEAWRVLKPAGIFIIVAGVTEIGGARSRKLNFIGIFDRLVAILYRVTGEEIPRNRNLAQTIEQELEKLGFSPTVEFVQQERARILRIRAEKRSLRDTAVG